MTIPSVVFDDLPRPDHLDVVRVAVPGGTVLPADPADLARAVFDVRSSSVPVRALFELRQKAVRLIGLQPAPRDVFAVRAVRDGEALIAADDRHLNFRAGVAARDGFVVITTAVQLHGWRGRLYFLPVRLLHPVITRAMIRGALRRLG